MPPARHRDTNAAPEGTLADPSAPVPVTRPGGGFGYVELGYVFAAVGAILFATKGVIIKLAYADGLNAEIVIAMRMALALPVYLAIGAMAVASRRRRGEPLPRPALFVRAVLVGLLGYWFASYVDFVGLHFISAQYERLILFTYPLFVVLFGAAFFGGRLRLNALAAIGVSWGGLALIFVEKFGEAGSDVALGSGLVLMAAIAFAFYQLLAKPIVAEMGPRLFTCVAMSGAAIGAFTTFALTQPIESLAVSSYAFGLMVFIALGATVLPSFFLSAALYRISAQANASIGTLSPVATILLAVIVLGEQVTMIDAVGAALVLAGVGWFTLNDRK